MAKTKRLLAVVRWPLGGIRTYMRYVYGHLGRDWRVTILAADVQEREALREDAAALGLELILAPASSMGFFQAVLRVFRQRRHDLIQSQGFISATATSAANIFFGVPHVLTVHGILEERLLQGVKGRIRQMVTSQVVRSVDAVYGVSEDILGHLREQVPGLDGSKVRQVAILNGIETGVFLEPGQQGVFRKRNGLADSLFLFVFLGRFMPQKGFDKIIRALALLEKSGIPRDYRLVAVGSGDYRQQYEKLAREVGIGNRIVFLPFQRDVAVVYRDVDAVLMPSNWEACPLQPMEAMVSGVPIVASDCIGLREVIRGTPAIVVPDGNPEGLARAMEDLLRRDHRPVFTAFRQEAAERFDVRRTAMKVAEFFECMIQ